MEIYDTIETGMILKTVDYKYAKKYRTKEILKQLAVTVCKQI